MHNYNASHDVLPLCFPGFETLKHGSKARIGCRGSHVLSEKTGVPRTEEICIPSTEIEVKSKRKRIEIEANSK